MAAPDSITTKDLTAVWVMNKTLSDDTDKILELQGVSWFKRKIISNSSLTLYVKHYKSDEDGQEHIDIKQVLSGGLSGSDEERTLDWQERRKEDSTFGAVIGKSKRMTVEEVEDEFLKNGWTDDTLGDGVVCSYVVSDTEKSKTTWTAEQIWGFEVINGERRYVRHVKFTGPKGEEIKAKLVYDYYNPTPFLNLTFHSGRRSYSLTLEPALVRVTRPFTSPWLLLVLGAAYIIGLAFLSRANSFQTPADAWVDCTSTYWLANDGCGLDGEACGPFDNSTFDFRCPSQCDSVILQNPRTVGDEQVVYEPLIVGGGDSNGTYRGDSFICAAAVQAGMFRDSAGGCATLELIGNFTDFLPTTAHGLSSIGFPSVFPLSFRFTPSNTLSHCADLRNPALAFNILVTWLLFWVLRPKPIVLYWCLVCIGYWHVALFSQPQGTPPPLDTAFGTFLPALFIAYAFWRLAFRFVLPAFSKAPIEASVWYLATFWAGVLTNITTDKIPIDRLVGSDIAQRPGAVTALVIIVIILVVIVINQIRVIRKTGWLPHYARWYIIGGLVTLVLALLPGLEFRIHHYVLAMVLIPGTAFPTRLSAIYQGFLLGMFLNGAAAFGFDSILQTAADLRRDAPIGSDLPTFLTNSSTLNTSIPILNQTLSWAPIPDGESWDGFALLVDDVERYVGTALNYSLAGLQAGLPHFFRVAFTSNGQAGDFTMPATLWPNGTWVDPLPGPS
ncbi:LCCL domain-containing protein [Heliocybe sulcata]|uniref:LCCL domain-containing protein n=1 Tax=Heliocybe sulcata TaxID=5364 RepID=A0A5C3NLD0_9AGAM|nr:LCCL domain-containing protein [Heliocybe sulcata]